MGPERNGEADLVRVMPRALAEEDSGDVCRLELIFGDEGALYDGVESLEVRVLFKDSCHRLWAVVSLDGGIFPKCIHCKVRSLWKLLQKLKIKANLVETFLCAELPRGVVLQDSS